LTPAPVLAVVGAVNVDLVLPVGEIPAPGETVLGGRLARFGGGKGANAAVAAARAGTPVSLIGAVGDDDYGRLALQDLTVEEVDCGTVAVSQDETTGVALILVAPGGENIIAVAPGANGFLDGAAVRAALGSLPSIACVLASTEVPLEAVRAAADESRRARIPFVLNPAPVRDGLENLLEYGPIVVPNRTECAQLAALVGRPGAGVVEDAMTIAGVTGSSVVVTLGKDGALVVEVGRPPEHIASHPVEAIDSTGAGDTFNGVLAAGLAARRPLTTAARRAAIAASLSVRTLGARTGMPTAAEIDAAAGA